MTRRHLIAALVASMWTATAAAQAPATTATLDLVLKRAADYVEQYQTDLTSIVAEERYVQDVRSAFGTSRASTRVTQATHVDLRSDLLFVKTTGQELWMQYRDVFEVDGRAVRDRTERLMKLLANPDQTDQRQIDGIQEESARYNIGPARRTLNMPMLALVFLVPDQQTHMKFSKVNPGNLDRFIGMASPGDIWAIEYRENKGDTVIRGAYDRDMPSRGRFWIDAASGAILRSEMVSEDPTVSDRIEVSYSFDQALQLLVPAEMRETLLIRLDNTRVEGRATYSRFRKFQVETDELIAPPIL